MAAGARPPSFFVVVAIVVAFAACGRTGAIRAPSDRDAGVGATDAAIGPTRTDGGYTDAGPLPEAIIVCPNNDAHNIGTNSAIVVHATNPIDTTTITHDSLIITASSIRIPGTITVAGSDIDFVPDASLPSNTVLQATLASGVRDQVGQPLAVAGSTWTFVTGAGPTPSTSFKFSQPQSPPNGSHAIDIAMTTDADRPILSWSSGPNVFATTPLSDGGFTPPSTVGVATGFETFQQLSLSAADGVAHFVWAMLLNTPYVYYSRETDDWATPATQVQFTQAMDGYTSYVPAVAAGSNHRVAIAWTFGEVAGADANYVATSNDGGATFGTPLQVSLSNGCPKPMYADGKLLVAWLDTTAGLPGGGAAIRMVTSIDNGRTFGAPITIATSTTAAWCPQLIDDGAGDVLVLYDEGLGTGPRAVHLVRFTPSDESVAPTVQLYAPDSGSHCSSLTTASTGRLVLAHSRGSDAFANDWTTHVRISDDHGQTFGVPTTVGVIDPGSHCPRLAYQGSGELTVAWIRNNDYALETSHGLPTRPCE